MVTVAQTHDGRAVVVAVMVEVAHAASPQFCDGAHAATKRPKSASVLISKPYCTEKNPMKWPYHAPGHAEVHP